MTQGDREHATSFYVFETVREAVQFASGSLSKSSLMTSTTVQRALWYCESGSSGAMYTLTESPVE